MSMYKIEKYFEELSRRILFFIFSMILTFSFFYWWSFDLFLFLSDFLFQENCQSFHDFEIHKFIFIDITEAFQTSLKISLLFTVCFHIPFFLYTLWAFLLPSLYSEEAKIFTCVTLFFLFFYSLICFFMIDWIFPKIWKFFLTFELSDSSLQIQCEPRISSFSSFFLKTFVFLQVFCQFPFWIFLSLFFESLDISFFFQSRKIFYWIFLVFSALIAPPDLFLQFSLSLFFFSFFEMIVFLACILVHYRKKRKDF